LEQIIKGDQLLRACNPGFWRVEGKGQAGMGWKSAGRSRRFEVAYNGDGITISRHEQTNYFLRWQKLGRQTKRHERLQKMKTIKFTWAFLLFSIVLPLSLAHSQTR